MIEFSSKIRIDRVTLYYLKVEVKREFSYGSWPRRFHCIVELEAEGMSGYGEICIPETDSQPFNPDIYNACYRTWSGLSLDAVFRMAAEKRGIFPDNILESTEMALIDLQGKLSGRSAADLLDLPEPTPIPGLYCILQHEPERLRAAAETFLKKGPVTHVKLKLFGNEEHDAKLIGVLRETMGKNCFIAGDVNEGYRCDLKKLTTILRHLADAGLNACEDPAGMTWEQWRTLQDSVPELHLIPDCPMRPAYKAVNSAKPGPGMICNLHPDCMGSITAAIALAKRLKRENIQVMIGDDSLVAAGCTAWQQIACGTGAVWVEALEKPEEFSGFAECVTSSAVCRGEDGKYAVSGSFTGFGLTVDRECLRKISCCCTEFGEKV